LRGQFDRTVARAETIADHSPYWSSGPLQDGLVTSAGIGCRIIHNVLFDEPEIFDRHKASYTAARKSTVPYFSFLVVDALFSFSLYFLGKSTTTGSVKRLISLKGDGLERLPSPSAF
jgi:hypothetical protein